ncbi:MAG: ATP-binding protein [Pseudomonadota bacterium]
MLNESAVRVELPSEIVSLSELLEDRNILAMRELSNALPIWYWETDENYIITFASDNIGRITSFTPDDLVGVNILNPQYGRGETEGGLAEYQNLLRKRRPVESVSYERILLTGERAILLDSALPKFAPDGKFTGYVGITFHLTRAMKMADENGSLLSSLQSRTVALEKALSQRNEDLANSNRLLAEILEALGEGLLVISHSDLRHPDNEIQFLNPAYRALMNLGEHQAYPGMKLAELSKFLSDRGDISQEDMEVRADGINAGEVFELNLASNGLSLEVKSIPRPDGGMVIVHSDVTKLRARTALLEKARRDAEQANKAKSDFLATMSHEIRTPMNGIVGVADLLQQTDLSEEQGEYVQTIRRSALALTELIGDILDFSKIEAGRLSLYNEPFDLHQLITDVTQMMMAIAQAKGISLSLDRAQTLPKVVMGDGKRLRQVLVNLLGNAVKFTQKGSVRFEVTQSNSGKCIFRVSDTGIGIPADKIDSIFESFEQVQSGLHREFEGTGLGLAITKNLVQSMGGEITVTSVDGEGTVFTSIVPLTETSMDSLEPDQDSAQVDLLSYAGCKVLLAEDNKTNQFVAKKMLQLHQIDPVIVSNGADACREAEGGAFDIIIMDLSMPEMSGLEATRTIRAAERKLGHPPAKIVALTGNAFQSDRDDCIAAGMDGFLTKPIRMRELAECLNRFATPDDAAPAKRSA